MPPSTFKHLTTDELDSCRRFLQDPRRVTLADQKDRARWMIAQGFEWLSPLADRITRLSVALGRLQADHMRAERISRDAEEGIRALDSLLNNLAAFAGSIVAIHKYARLTSQAASAIIKAQTNQELVRVPMKYWPGVAEFKPVWTPAEAAAVRSAAGKIAAELATDIGFHAVRTLCRKLGALFQPSGLARALMRDSPEHILSRMKVEVRDTMRTADEAGRDQLKRLELRLADGRTRRDEYLAFVDHYMGP